MSFRSLVKSTVLLGSTSAANTVIGVLRVKVMALLIGPAGVGVLGALAGIASLGTIIAASGSDTAGTRHLALQREDAASVGRLRLVLILIALVHGLVVGGLVYALREPIAQAVFGDASQASAVGWMGLAVMLSLLAGLQITQLQGLGRVSDVARVSILSSIASTCIGLLAVWRLGAAGLVVVVLAQPACSVLLAWWRTADLPIGSPLAIGASEIGRRWRGLITQGSAYMLSFLILSLVPLAIRAVVIQEQGLDASGHFHAAWTISVIYVGFLMAAMSADYFPRLTGAIGDTAASNRLINDQIQLCLALGGPVLLSMLALAPWVVPILYSVQFQPAVPVLEWQTIGNVLKIAGWPLAFLSMARGQSLIYLTIEAAWCALFLVLAVLGQAEMGLTAVGMAFAVACLAYLVMQSGVAVLVFGFRFQRRTIDMLVVFLLAGTATMLAGTVSELFQAGMGLFAGVALGLGSLRLILTKMGPHGRYVGMARSLFRRIGWPIET
jgi:PST family polysaccharide transporter